MKYSKYLLFLFILSFVLVLKVFASTEDYYNLDDLTMSKTVLNGSKIMTGNYYPEGLMVQYDDVTIPVEKNSSFIIGNGSDQSCYSIQKIENNVIFFAKSTCKEYEEPTASNGYTIGYKGLYRWYKVKDVSVITDGFMKENNEYVGVNGSFKVDYEAAKGEILFFQMKNLILDDSLLEIFVDGKKIPVSNHVVMYQNIYLRSDSDGEHSLIINYTNQNDSYVLVKNFMLLKEYSNENKLSTFGLDNRSRMYYEILDKDIIGMGILTYINSETLDGDPFIGNNPNTVDIIPIILTLFVVVFISLGFSIYKVHKTQKFKVHEEIE